MTCEKKQRFYDRLKSSVVVENLGLQKDKLPKTPQEISEQLTEINKVIMSQKQNSIYGYCLIGRNLAALGLKGKELINSAHQYLPATHYGRSQIYFLMNLYELAMKYNKLSRVSIGIGELKTKFKLVRELMQENDRDWILA